MRNLRAPDFIPHTPGTTLAPFAREIYAYRASASRNPGVRVTHLLAARWIKAEITLRLLKANVVGISSTTSYGDKFIAHNPLGDTPGIIAEASRAYANLAPPQQDEFFRAFGTAVYYERQILEHPFRSERYA